METIRNNIGETKMLTLFTVKTNRVTNWKDGTQVRNTDYLKEARGERVYTFVHPDVFFDTQKEATDFIKTLTTREDFDKYYVTYDWFVEPITYTHANHYGYSDIHPFEIVKVISQKTIEVRAMDAEKDPTWKPEFVSGGFAGHCVNNNEQRWIFKSNPEGQVVRVRKGKNGWKSSCGRHHLDQEPNRKYDYNF